MIKLNKNQKKKTENVTEPNIQVNVDMHNKFSILENELEESETEYSHVPNISENTLTNNEYKSLNTEESKKNVRCDFNDKHITTDLWIIGSSVTKHINPKVMYKDKQVIVATLKDKTVRGAKKKGIKAAEICECDQYNCNFVICPYLREGDIIDGIHPSIETGVPKLVRAYKKVLNKIKGLKEYFDNCNKSTRQNKNFAPFLVSGTKWEKKTKTTTHRGFENDGEEVPEGNRKKREQKVSMLELRLGQIANYCPIISRNTIVKNSTSIDNIWETVRLHYGFQITGAHFVDFDAIHYDPGERPEDLYQRLMAFIEDSLLRKDMGITHHDEDIEDDENYHLH
ncbi:unnamed protein product [Mytilus coruscus]|uniref:Uncharacterized protein n=1 Tax=Mytilus coruscus TaxID=42192 RepID=A0A6J8CCD6_MYTCO|nr:unnamed protein product [Mytilus coruscus]